MLEEKFDVGKIRSSLEFKKHRLELLRGEASLHRERQAVRQDAPAPVVQLDLRDARGQRGERGVRVGRGFARLRWLRQRTNLCLS